MVGATSPRSDPYLIGTSRKERTNAEAALARQGNEEEGLRFLQRKNTQINYKDTTLLRKYVSDRGKIRARRVTGNCVQHQRDVAIAVKNSREVALLPYATVAR